MATKKPVHWPGGPKEFEATDTIPMANLPEVSGNNKYFGTDGSGVKGAFDLPTFTSPNVRQATLGEPVGNGKLIYVSAADTVMLADANVPAKGAVGFVQTGGASGASVQVNYGPGIITGLSGGTPGAKGYLSSVQAGEIEATSAVGPGDYGQDVGSWITPSVFLFNPQQGVIRATT